MKKNKVIKFWATLIVVLMLSMCLMNLCNTVNAAYYATTSNEFEFNAQELQEIYAENQTGGTAYKTHRYDVTAEMINNKTAILMSELDCFTNGEITPTDISSLLSIISGCYKETDNVYVLKIINSLEKALSYDASQKVSDSNIELKISVKYPAIEEYNIAEVNKIFSTKNTTKEDVAETLKKLNENDKIIMEKENIKDDVEVSGTIVRVDAIMPDGAVYSLCLGKNGNYSNRWYMVRTKEAPAKPEEPKEPVEKFETELTYTAKVDEKEVGGTIVNGTYLPNYDKEKVEKDADVTAIIKSKDKVDIVKINDVALNEDGTPNSLGWYYPDKEDKTVIAKLYPFDKYNNLTANGMVTEKDLVITGANGKTDKQTVSIKWPFRIIKVEQDPEEIKEDTEKVIVTITTNLPMDKDKLPDGWAFTDDDEGKTQHKISKEFLKKNGNKSEEPIVTANGRDDTDTTKLAVKWPEKDKSQSPNLGPQGGAFTIGLIITIIGILGYGVTRYLKLRK